MTNGERTSLENASGYPFRIFISHKISGHGKAAIKIKRELEIYSDKLKIFVSPALSPGTVWNPRVLEEIEKADLFVMLYLVQGIEMDWCLYEAGYFEREALKTNRKLICVTNPGSNLPGPLENRQRIEADQAGIERLLKAIYSDAKKPIRPDLFSRENMDTLNRLIEFILKELGPVRRLALTPRMWITVSGIEQIEKINSGELPGEVRLEGEAGALKEFGVGEGAGISLKEFYKLSEFKQTLDYYIPHLANALKRIMDKRIEQWRIPPVRVTKEGAPKVLVPAYFEKGQDNSYRFEFLYHEPLPNYVLRQQSSFATLYNLFVLAWQFRWRIIEQWLERLMDLRSLGSKADQNDFDSQVQKFRLDFGSILLEALNRSLDSPRKILKQFPQEKEKKLLHKIIDPDDGLYTKIMQKLDNAIKEIDLDQIVEALIQMKDLNKTILVLTLKRLNELAMEKDGELIQIKSE
ncbi:MAG: hypothetical protein PVH85_11485 [Desulfobacterales bacterium]|jgi:hypothetical protein